MLFYAYNRLTATDGYAMEFLPQLLLAQYVDTIKSLRLKWYLPDIRPQTPPTATNPDPN
jgi:hypothetical protein